MRHTVRWAGPVLVLMELALVLSGQLTLRSAAVVFVVLEAALALLVVGQLAGGVRQYRRQRAGGTDRDQALRDALQAVLPAPVALLVRQELLTWSSLALLLRRRQHGVKGRAVAVPYDAALRPLGVVLLSLSVLELVVLELVIPWPSVRLVLLVLGVWTLLFVLGMTAGNIVRPHVIGDGELRLRFGTRADAQIPLDRVLSARVQLRSAPGSKVLLLHDGALVMAVSGMTNVDVQLTEPTVLPTSQGALTVSRVHFAADDPTAGVRALQARVAVARDDRPY